MAKRLPLSALGCKWRANQKNKGMCIKKKRELRNYTEIQKKWEKIITFDFKGIHNTHIKKPRREKKRSELTLNTVEKNTNRLAQRNIKEGKSGMRRRRERE